MMVQKWGCDPMKRKEISKIFRSQPTIETERLILRRLTVMDAGDMYAYSSDEVVPQYLTWEVHPSEEYTRRYLAYLEGRYAIGEFFDWAVVEKASGRMVGTCGFTRFHYEHDVAEVGYVLSRDVWGRGYAPEALRAVITFGFERLSLRRIEARYMDGNFRSRRVAEKCGMTHEGYLRDAMLVKGEYRTIGVASILRREYECGRKENDTAPQGQ